MRHLILFVMMAAAATAQPTADVQRAADYLAAHYQSPEDYVISKFKNHDIVFLGESAHGVRENELFLQKLIPLLYKAGVRDLGYEMALSDDQAEIDRILAADRYDKQAVLTLLFHWDAQIGWAFQEYADVLRAAWTLNHSLP